MQFFLLLPLQEEEKKIFLTKSPSSWLRKSVQSPIWASFLGKRNQENRTWLVSNCVCGTGFCPKAYHPQCVGQDPAILEKNVKWVCGWHSCFNCNKSSDFKCFCCPNSVCRSCLRIAEFVLIRGKKGICNDCLKLALLIEENQDEDSDGGKVDFNDSETFEFLFKGYWQFVKEKEGLRLEDLHTADGLLKKGQNCLEGSLQLLEKEELVSSVGKMENIHLNSLIKKTTKTMKGVWLRKREFVGWGSKDLLDFLTSIGTTPHEPMSQQEVYEIIMDYIHVHKLANPEKKKKTIVCDSRLQALFRRKVVKRRRISCLLEPHLAENMLSEEESSCGSEEDDFSNGCKKQRRFNSNLKSEPKVYSKDAEIPIHIYPAIIRENITLVYLRRSLIEKLLKDHETIEDKMRGSFVRVRLDNPNDLPTPAKSFQLVQVTGVERASEAYKTREITTDIILRVTNMQKDVLISMISDDDFSEEECENLHQRVNEGLVKRPTLLELGMKARSLHEDITNYWIDKELVKLENLIDRANEKGWRRELFEYVDRKELLETPEERSRLLKVEPKVVPDVNLEVPASSSFDVDVERVLEAGEMATTYGMDDESENEGDESVTPQKSRKRGRPKVRRPSQLLKKLRQSADRQEVPDSALSSLIDAGSVVVYRQDVGMTTTEGGVEAITEKADESGLEGAGSTLTVWVQHEIKLSEPTHSKEHEMQKDVTGERLAKKAANPNVSSTEIIEIDDDNEMTEDGKKVDAFLDNSVLWHYKDPSGNTQGPFPISSLRGWKKSNFFGENFKVWRSDQAPSEAILLTEALQLMPPTA